MKDYLEINTDSLEAPEVGQDLISNRDTIAKSQSVGDKRVTVLVQAYNRIEKTRVCIENILKHTKGVEYELLLVDNGSTDGTLAYFQSVPYAGKKILHITKNIGSAFGGLPLSVTDFREFVVTVPNDIIVTENWLSNLVACADSDKRIGMIATMSNNSSNMQNVELPYSTMEEMQRKAAEFNHSDPRTWEDRMRIVTLCTLYRKSALLCVGWPPSDLGFFHDFADDDVAFAIRRAGYRTIVTGDTWVCHDHVYRGGEIWEKSLEIGRKNFRDKYFGVDAWDDVNNTWRLFLEHFPLPAVQRARVLGVDVRCGTPILDMKNWLRHFDIYDAELSAFTQDVKYWIDLRTICAGPVICDREEYLAESFPRDYFDYVLLDRPINRYHEPQKMLNDAFALCKPGGIVSCRFKNTADFQTYAYALGQRDVYDVEYAYHIPVEVMQAALSRLGSIKSVIYNMRDVSDEIKTAVRELLPKECSSDEQQPIMDRLLCRDFIFVVRKND